MQIEKEVIERTKEMARNNFISGLNCCESVFEALHSAGIIGEEDIPYSACKMCAGYGGGIGLAGYTCGALNGAVLAVGARYGRKDPKAEDAVCLYDKEYLRYNNMIHDFKVVNKGVLCKEIGADYKEDFNCPERKKLCESVVQSGVEIACRYLAMPDEEVEKLTYIVKKFE